MPIILPPILINEQKRKKKCNDGWYLINFKRKKNYLFVIEKSFNVSGQKFCDRHKDQNLRNDHIDDQLYN